MTASQLAIIISLLAIASWIAVGWQTWRYRAQVVHSAVWQVSCVAGLMASIGSLASALAFASARGEIPVQLDPIALSFVASMGRGALIMGAVIAFSYFEYLRRITDPTKRH